MKILNKQLVAKIAFFLMVFCCLSSKGETYEWSDSSHMQIDAAGNVVAVWQTYDSIGGIYQVNTSVYDAATATWSPSTIISNPAVNSFTPRLDMNSNGNAVVMWLSVDSFGISTINASIRLAGGSFQTTPTQLSDVNDLVVLNQYDIKLNDADEAVAYWMAFVDNTYISVVRSALGDISTGVWGAPTTLSS